MYQYYSGLGSSETDSVFTMNLEQVQWFFILCCFCDCTGLSDAFAFCYVLAIILALYCERHVGDVSPSAALTEAAYASQSNFIFAYMYMHMDSSLFCLSM